MIVAFRATDQFTYLLITYLLFRSATIHHLINGVCGLLAILCAVLCIAFLEKVSSI